MLVNNINPSTFMFGKNGPSQCRIQGGWAMRVSMNKVHKITSDNIVLYTKLSASRKCFLALWS